MQGMSPLLGLAGSLLAEWGFGSLQEERTGEGVGEGRGLARPRQEVSEGLAGNRGSALVPILTIHQQRLGLVQLSQVWPGSE